MPAMEKNNKNMSYDDDNEDDYYDAEDAVGKNEGVVMDNVIGTLTSSVPKPFLSFFGDDDNYDDVEEEPLPFDDNLAVRHTLVSGGPVEPNYAGMTVAAANMAQEQYVKERKHYTDRQRHLRMKQTEGVIDSDIVYHGDQSKKLRMMKDVTAKRTNLDDNFISKHIVSLRFAEEAIQVLKNVVCEKSDANMLSVIGVGFLCTAC